MALQALEDKFESARGTIFAAALAAPLALNAFGTVTNNAHAEEIKTIAVETTAISPRDALNMSDNRVLLHYGKGIRDIDVAVSVITDREGIESIAIPGGPAGKIALLVDGKVCGMYTQSDLDRGLLMVVAIEKYKREVASIDNNTAVNFETF